MSACRTALLSLIALGALGPSCVFQHLPCESNDQCSGLFGEGSVCGGSGYCSDPGVCSTDADCIVSVGFGSVCNESDRCEDLAPHPRCEKTYPTDLWENLDSYRDHIVFGSLQDRNDIVHAQRENAVEAGLVVINESTEGRRFATVFCDVFGGPDNPYDELARPDAALETATWLGESGIHVLLGPSSSGDTQLVYTELVAGLAPEMIIISPAASSPALSTLDTIHATDEAPGLLWRTAPLSDPQGGFLAEDLYRRGFPEVSHVAVIREEGAFGEGIAEPFIERWAGYGGTSEQFIFPDGNASARTEQITLAGTKAAGFQAVVFIAQAGDSAAFMEQATANANYSDSLLIYFPQTGSNDSVFATAENNRLFTRVRAATPRLPDDFVYQSFHDFFVQRFDEDPADYHFTANAYDAVWMAALGSLWSEAHEERIYGLGIARGVRRLIGGDIPISFTQSSWSNAALHMRQGDRLDIRGASGALDYDLSTEEHTAPLQLLEGSADGVFLPVR